MSYMALVEFRDGKADTEIAFNNAWGGAARIWGAIFNKYIEKNSEWDHWMAAAADGRLWKAIEDPRMSEIEQHVFAFTFDNVLIKWENFSRMSVELLQFAKDHPVSEGSVDHLPAMAEHFKNSSAEAIGLYATSVGENPWFTWTEEDETEVPYDLNNGDKHWFLFDELSKK